MRFYVHEHRQIKWKQRHKSFQQENEKERYKLTQSTKHINENVKTDQHVKWLQQQQQQQPMTDRTNGRTNETVHSKFS